MRIFLFTVFLFSIPWLAVSGEAESMIQKESQLNFNTQIDFVSSHVWRGGKSGTAPSIEPLLELGFGNFILGSWAAATFDGSYKELDVYAIFKLSDFSVGLYDYYCPPEKPQESVFTNFHGPDTYHLFSIDLVYNGTKKFPVKLTASTMMYGMDFDQTNGDYYYSTYLEVAYSKNWKNNTISALVGLTTHEGIYANRLAIMNSELMYKKNFAIRDVSIPIFTKVVYNPYTSEAWLIGGVSLNRVFGF